MIERVHEHIISELSANTRTDTIFVIVAIFLNLLTLGINSGVAAGGGNGTQTIIMFTLVALLIVVNLVAEVGLIRGRQTRISSSTVSLRCIKTRGWKATMTHHSWVITAPDITCLCSLSFSRV